jgi:hypothetical protein
MVSRGSSTIPRSSSGLLVNAAWPALTGSQAPGCHTKSTATAAAAAPASVSFVMVHQIVDQRKRGVLTQQQTEAVLEAVPGR